MAIGLKQDYTLCFIHGWGFDSSVLESLAAELPASKTHLLDLPGYGKKQNNKLSADINAVSDAILDEVPGNSVLVGWSLGGMVAIKIAHKLREGVRAIILLASSPCFVKKDDWPHGVEQAMLQNMGKRVVENIDNVLQEFAGLTAYGDASPKNTLRKLKILLDKSNANTETLLVGLNMLINTDLRQEFAGLECGIMMISGKRDQLIMAETGAASLEINPDVQLVEIPNAGHAPFISRQADVYEAINNYLRNY